MSDKTKNKLLIIFIGIFISLLSAILIINVGYLARALAFPLLYLFGVGDYIIYAFFFIFGIYFAFRSKYLVSHKVLFNIGIIISFLGLTLLYTQIMVYSNPNGFDCVSVYNSRFFSVPNGYFNTKIYNQFTTGIGGGFIAFCITGLLNACIGRGLTLLIVIAILVIGLLLIALPYLLKLFKRKVKEKKVDNEDIKNEEEILVTDNLIEEKIDDNNSAIIEENIEEKKEAIDPFAASIPPSANNNPNSDQLGQFKEVDFVLDYIKNKPQKFDTQKDESVTVNNSIDDEQKDNEIENSPNISNSEVKYEQVLLDENAKPQFDEELLTAKNEFVEPTVIAGNDGETINESEEKIEENVNIDNSEEKIEEKPTVIEKKPWIPPSFDLLNKYEFEDATQENIAVAEERKDLINAMFNDFSVGAKCVGYTIGPSITRFNIDYTATTQIKAVNNLITDIGRKLNGTAIRFEQYVTGSQYSGIEVPNAKSTIVPFRDLLEALPDTKKNPFAVAFGKNIGGEVVFADYAEFPHLMVAGTTGSGKSVFINSIIATLLMRCSPYDLKLALIDPKRVEFGKYKEIPHLLCPIINEPEKAKNLFIKMCDEMNARYTIFENIGVSNLKDYNEMMVEEGKPTLPRVIIIIDEYADLVEGCKEISAPIQSLCQKARAAGIHLLIATQRPTVNIINGTIKANVNTRVSLLAASFTDSQTILDEGGAEKLLGYGDMLARSPLISRDGPIRMQGCYIKNIEVLHICNYLRNNYPTMYDGRFLDLEDKTEIKTAEMIASGALSSRATNSDADKYETIKEWAACQEYISMSKIQREFEVGFNHAGKIMKRLQEEGVAEKISSNPSRGFKVLDKSARFYEDSIPTSDEQEVK